MSYLGLPASKPRHRLDDCTSRQVHAFVRASIAASCLAVWQIPVRVTTTFKFNHLSPNPLASLSPCQDAVWSRADVLLVAV
jgi:hypothetical protein